MSDEFVCLMGNFFFLFIYSSLFLHLFFIFSRSLLLLFTPLFSCALQLWLRTSLSLSLSRSLSYLVLSSFSSLYFIFISLFSFPFLLVSFLPFFLLQQLPCPLQKQNTCSCYRSILPASSKKPFRCPFLPLSLLFLPHTVLKSCWLAFYHENTERDKNIIKHRKRVCAHWEGCSLVSLN